MASITALISGDGAVASLAKQAALHMKKEISLGVRDQLAMIENQHKKKEILRQSDSKSRAKKGSWTTRTGEAIKSFHRDWTPGSLVGAYGSDLARIKKLEYGGIIKPKGTFLAIPTEHAPKGVWPRYIPDLVYLQSLKGQPLLVKPTGGTSFLVMFILRRQVKLPPRPTMDRAVAATEKKRDERMVTAVERALGSGKNGKP